MNRPGWRWMWRCWWLISCLLFLLSCGKSTPVFHDSGQPLRLSEWNLFTFDQGSLIPNEETLVFQPTNPLFTDYASKLRTLWVSGGSDESAGSDESRASGQTSVVLKNNELEFPVGSVLTKTFYYSSDQAGDLRVESGPGHEYPLLNAGKIIETRLLVRRSSGWEAFPYIWNDEQTEAFLRVAGGSARISLKRDKLTGGNLSEEEQLDFTYFVPNENQCAGCHVTEHPDGEMHPLGATYQQLAVDNSASSVLAAMQAKGWLQDEVGKSELVSWQDETQDIEERALAYLNIHCGHCHNPDGPADTSALILDGSASSLLAMGVCKPPVAAGGGAGDLHYGIVPGEPDASILPYRMASTDPAVMMPELGRSLVHEEGVALIRQWIEQMETETETQTETESSCD